jgi:biotin carboxylase
MEKHLAIIGASYLQLPLIEKAKQMGFTTHVFAWAADDVGEKAADHFYPISIVEKEQILEKCREIGICGICSIASDLAVVTVNYVSNALGLCGNSDDSTVICTNKHEMRLAFEKNGDPSPKSYLVDLDTDLSNLDISFPVIVKPTDRSGSRGIFKLTNPEMLKDAVARSISESFEKKALVEEYVEGQEYSVECISFKGEHHLLAVTFKKTTGAPYFIETGHTEPAMLSEEIHLKVKNVIFHALDTLHITNSASHSEIKIDGDGNIKIIEIASRMGGDLIGSDLVKYSTGIDFVKAVVQVACGTEPDLVPKTEPMPVEVRFIMTEHDVEIMKELMDTDRFIRLAFFEPENIGRTTDSSNRAGCYIIKASSPQI